MIKKLRILMVFVLLSGLAAITTQAALASNQPALAAATVDPTNVYVSNFEGWGTSLVWFANVTGGWSDANRNALADLIYGSNGLRLNIARYNIGGSSASQQGMRPGGLVRSYINSSGVYDWTVDANQRWWLSAAISRGANITEAFSNSPPWYMTNSGDTRGASGCGDNLPSSQNDAFAEYLTEVVKHFRDSWGVTFRTLDPLNEPMGTWWCLTGRQEGAHIGRSQQSAIVQLVGQKLASKGLTGTKVSAPDETSPGETITSINAYTSTAKGYVAQINTHTYSGNSTDKTNVRNLATSLGKRLWMSEIDGSAGTHNHNDIAPGLWLAARITEDINFIRPAAWIHWQVIEDEANMISENQNWGVIHASMTGGETWSLTKKYYVMGNYTKFIRPGYQIIGSGDSRAVTAYSPSTSTLVIVLYNNTTSNSSVTYNLTGFATVTGPATPYRTSASENLVQLSNITITNRQFSATANANSVTTYVITGVSGTGPTPTPNPITSVNDNTIGTGQNQFNYTGTWSYGSQTGAYLSDNHWSSAVNNAYQVAFTGTKAQLYAAKANNHGILAVSIDGGTEVMVDLYSSTRADQVLVWTSPTLTSGSHTIKVRVTGTKNASSSGTAIVGDRIDITQ
jgi:O-glycosyl hydrolase